MFLVGENPTCSVPVPRYMVGSSKGKFEPSTDDMFVPHPDPCHLSKQGAYRASEMAKKASIAAILIGLAWQIATAVYETSADSPDENEGSFRHSPDE